MVKRENRGKNYFHPIFPEVLETCLSSQTWLAISMLRNYNLIYNWTNIVLCVCSVHAQNNYVLRYNLINHFSIIACGVRRACSYAIAYLLTGAQHTLCAGIVRVDRELFHQIIVCPIFPIEPCSICFIIPNLWLLGWGHMESRPFYSH